MEIKVNLAGHNGMVSVLIITWKRAALLQKCLSSLAPWAEQTALQVVVVLNGEDDGTAALLRDWGTPWLEWRQIARTTPGAARNAGLADLKGEWCFFIDDDATVTPQHLSVWQEARATLPGADVIGGPDTPAESEAPLARALSITLASPLCTGPTSGRHHPMNGFARRVDEKLLTSCNLWMRTSWLRGGRHFPEEHRRGEETLLLQEMVDLGAQCWYVPALQVRHARRNSWGEIARASFWGGHWRAHNMRLRGGSFWFLLPSLFVMLHFLLWWPLTWWLMGAWCVPVALKSVWVARTDHTVAWWRVMALHWYIPFCYGCGFWRGSSPWKK